jgi:Bestrophin, RFP-TM, chloride channel
MGSGCADLWPRRIGWTVQRFQVVSTPRHCKSRRCCSTLYAALSGLVVVYALIRRPIVTGLTTRHQLTLPKHLVSPGDSDGLFRDSPSRRLSRSPQPWHQHIHGKRSTRRFVLTTPEAIIEQASTTKLLDDLIDESVRTSARRPIMMQFDPSSGWIWKRWKGTVFSETWDACVYRMIYACIVFLLCKSFPETKELLGGFSILWGQLLSVTTFTLTFFVNQSYALWRKCSELSRSLQGRLHDMDMTLAAHATRRPSKAAGETSKYTSESKQILEVVGRYVRLFNLLTYASFTRSHRPVLTPRGMRRLVERGLMTPLEREVLVNSKLPATQRHNAVLLWIVRTFIEGTEAGHFTGGAGFEQQFIEKAHVCRAAYGAIGDELQGRMPLAYAHIVQVLVDLVLALYPFMAYSAGMSGFVCVIGTGLLTIGYQGLVRLHYIILPLWWDRNEDTIRSNERNPFYRYIQADLAKQFLDPYDNENYGKGEDPLVVDTLIAETNAGSTRWMDGLAEMPVASQKIRDGDLSEYILPRRGYTVEELQIILEEQRVQKEKREKEDLERQRKKEQEERERSWSEAMIPALVDTNSTIVSSPDRIKYSVVAGTTWRHLNLTNYLTSATTSMAETVNSLTFSQNSNATSLQITLVPEGTAPAMLFDLKKSSVTIDFPSEIVEQVQEVMVDNVGDDVEVEEHVSSVSLVDATVEAPNVTIEVTEVVDEVLATEAVDAPFTVQDYESKIKEILDAKKEDIRLTRAILTAPPGADVIEDLEDKGETSVDSSVSAELAVNATGSDTLPSDHDAVSEAAEVDSVATDSDVAMTSDEILEAEKLELLETQAILNARPAAESIEVLEEEISSLLKPSNSTEPLERIVITDVTTTTANATLFNVVEGNTTAVDNLSVLGTETTEIIDRIFLLDNMAEDYEEEILETEAILNAPPGADSIDVPEEEEVPGDSEDDLAILEMDEPDLDASELEASNSTVPELIVSAEPNFAHDILNVTSDTIGSPTLPIAMENDGSRLER